MKLKDGFDYANELIEVSGLNVTPRSYITIDQWSDQGVISQHVKIINAGVGRYFDYVKELPFEIVIACVLIDIKKYTLYEVSSERVQYLNGGNNNYKKLMDALKKGDSK